MKKINLLIPALVAVTASPFIGLTSCFEDEDDPTPPGPKPKDYVVLDSFNVGETGNASLRSSEKFFIKENTSYYFKIDTTKWKASKFASDYTYCNISIDYYDAYLEESWYGCYITNDFEMLIDGKLLDKSLWRIDDNDACIEIDPEGLEKILKGEEVIGHLHASELQCYSTDKCYFHFYAETRK